MKATNSAAQIGLIPAVAIGLASMLGAGVFVVFRDAAKLSGDFLFAAIALAGLVAILNAASVYQLARVVDRPGGVYSYSRVYLNPTASFIAGFPFVFGKIGSIAAIAMVFGEYVWPEQRLLVAVLAIALLTLINLLGINRTAGVAMVLATVTTSFLIFSIAATLSWFGVGSNAPAVPQPLTSPVINLSDVLTAASIIFFAFAGYARVATLGTEVRDAKRNIPRAIAISLGAVLALYALLALTLKLALGSALTSAVAPFLQLDQKVFPWLPQAVVVLVASLACLGSILALLAGVSRTAATMAEDLELPAVFAKRNRAGSPWVAEVCVSIGACILVQIGELSWVIGFSSFAVLVYYSIGHLAVLRQPANERLQPRWLAAFGFLLCATLALAVPGPAVVISSAIIVAALLIRRLSHRADRR